MAFTFIPKNYAEVAGIPAYKKYVEDYFKLFNHFEQKYPSINFPFALDTTAPSKVKITRRISPLNLQTLKSGLKINLSMAFGEGSRKGASTEARVNLGTKFESDLVNDINKYIRGENPYFFIYCNVKFCRSNTGLSGPIPDAWQPYAM